MRPYLKHFNRIINNNLQLKHNNKMENYIIIAKDKETGIHSCYTVKAKNFIAAIRDNEIRINLQGQTIVQITIAS